MICMASLLSNEKKKRKCLTYQVKLFPRAGIESSRVPVLWDMKVL